MSLQDRPWASSVFSTAIAFRKVTPAFEQRVERFAAAGWRLHGAQELEQVDQVGRRAEDRLALLAGAGVARAEQRLQVRQRAYRGQARGVGSVGGRQPGLGDRTR